MIIFKSYKRESYAHEKGDIHIVDKNGNGIRLKNGYFQYYNYNKICNNIYDNDYLLIPQIKLISKRILMWKMRPNIFKEGLVLRTPNGDRTIYIDEKGRVNIHHSRMGYYSKRDDKLKSVILKSNHESL